MNLKSLVALALTASVVPLASAGPLAYGLCQTGGYPPTDPDFLLTRHRPVDQAAMLLGRRAMPPQASLLE